MADELVKANSEYLLTLRIKLRAVDDLEARNHAVQKLTDLGLSRYFYMDRTGEEGIDTKLQRLEVGAPPAGVIFNIDDYYDQFSKTV
jgi:hypothetical protein